jgi:hypothetical protein
MTSLEEKEASFEESNKLEKKDLDGQKTRSS